MIKVNDKYSIFVRLIAIMTVLALSIIMPRALATNSPTAKMTATDASDCGSRSVTTWTNITTQLTGKSSGIAKIEYYLNGTLKDTNSKAGNTDGIVIDCSKLDNGEYHLSAKLYDGDGNTGIATTMSGKDYLTFTVKNSATSTNNVLSATYSTTDGGVYGNGKSWYPRNYLLLLTDISSNVTKIEYYLNNSLVATNSKVNGRDGYTIDATTLASGKYSLVVKLYDKDGNTAIAKHIAGFTQSSFTIDNSVASTTASPVTSTDCSSKQKSINEISSRITTRSTAYLTTVDTVASATQIYYSQHPTSIANYQDLNDKISAADNTASDALINVIAKSSISCGSDGKPDLAAFKAAVSALQSAIHDYRKAVTNLIVALEK